MKFLGALIAVAKGLSFLGRFSQNQGPNEIVAGSRPTMIPRLIAVIQKAFLIRTTLNVITPAGPPQ